LSRDEVENHADYIAKHRFSIMENTIDADFLTAIKDQHRHLWEVRIGGDIWQRIAVHP
jgi:hypothetical protein